MEVKELLPIGSIVRLKNGTKKIMIIGVKQTDLKTNTLYDYLALPYPEGFMGADVMFFINHQAIEEIYFKGFIDEERDDFLEKLERFYQENA